MLTAHKAAWSWFPEAAAVLASRANMKYPMITVAKSVTTDTVLWLLWKMKKDPIYTKHKNVKEWMMDGLIHETNSHDRVRTASDRKEYCLIQIIHVSADVLSK